MAQFASSGFTGTALTELASVIGAFSKQTGHTTVGLDIYIGSTGAYAIGLTQSSGYAVYQHSGTPAAADYTVSVDIAQIGTPGSNPFFGVCGRMAAAAQTYYFAGYRHGTGLQLYKCVAGANTQLGSDYSYTLSSSVNLKLVMNGSSISVELNGSTVIGPITDTSITDAGKAGIFGRTMRTPGVEDTFSIDNFSADDIGGGGGGSTVPNQIITPNQTTALGSAARRFV